MQCASVSSETRPNRPIVIWTPESDELSAQLASKLDRVNAELKTRVKRQKERARPKGTNEWRYLQQFNAEDIRKDQKNFLHDFGSTVTGAGKVIQETVEDKIRWVWYHDEVLKQKADFKVSLEFIQGPCNRAKATDPAHRNRFNDSL